MPARSPPPAPTPANTPTPPAATDAPNPMADHLTVAYDQMANARKALAKATITDHGGYVQKAKAEVEQAMADFADALTYAREHTDPATLSTPPPSLSKPPPPPPMPNPSPSPSPTNNPAWITPSTPFKPPRSTPKHPRRRPRRPARQTSP